MQLSASQLVDSIPIAHRSGIGGSWLCIQKILREEGIKGFYKGLTASYLGVTEGTIQWVLYERLKKMTTNTERKGSSIEWLGTLSSAGIAKCVASLVSYPHEVSLWFFLPPHLKRSYIIAQVLRTRLREPCVNSVIKYTGLWQTLRLIIAEEGVKSLYGGLSAHLMRVVPNAAVMFFIYEGILRWWSLLDYHRSDAAGHSTSLTPASLVAHKHSVFAQAVHSTAYHPIPQLSKSLIYTWYCRSAIEYICSKLVGIFWALISPFLPCLCILHLFLPSCLSSFLRFLLLHVYFVLFLRFSGRG